MEADISREIIHLDVIGTMLIFDTFCLDLIFSCNWTFLFSTYWSAERKYYVLYHLKVKSILTVVIGKCYVIVTGVSTNIKHVY